MSLQLAGQVPGVPGVAHDAGGLAVAGRVLAREQDVGGLRLRVVGRAVAVGLGLAAVGGPDEAVARAEHGRERGGPGDADGAGGGGRGGFGEEGGEQGCEEPGAEDVGAELEFVGLRGDGADGGCHYAGVWEGWLVVGGERWRRAVS